MKKNKRIYLYHLEFTWTEKEFNKNHEILIKIAELLKLQRGTCHSREEIQNEQKQKPPRN